MSSLSQRKSCQFLSCAVEQHFALLLPPALPSFRLDMFWPIFDVQKPKFVMYESEISHITFGPHQVIMRKDHLVYSRRCCSGTTYYTHSYMATMGMNSNPCPSALDSTASLAAIGPNSQECMKAKKVSKAEALVSQFPNSSNAWVDGASIYFYCDGVQKAKMFLQRGIITINSSEKQEILNLWITLMYLEAEFGTKEDLLGTFENALKNNNKRDLCMQVLRWLTDDGITEALEIIKDRILKGFKSKKDVYLILCEYYMKHGAKEKARSLLERSLQYVPPKEHSDILRHFSNLEDKYGA